VPHEHRVDAIYVLDKGLVARADHETGLLERTPSSSTDLLAVRSDNPLLGMLLQLYPIYAAAWRPDLDLSKYFGSNLGEPMRQVTALQVTTDAQAKPTAVFREGEDR
jgi:hypothetical protein